MKDLYVIIHRIYENKPYPIVTHVFTGKTAAEARSYYNAHLVTDAFLRACTESGRFADFSCTVDLREGWLDPHGDEATLLFD